MDYKFICDNKVLNGHNAVKPKKVLLVQPYYPGTYFINQYIPAGLGYLAEYLEFNGHMVEVIDMTLGYEIDDLIIRIDGIKPDIFGMTMMTYMFNNSFEILKTVREKNPEIKIIVGGPHVSTYRQKVLETCPAIDYGCVLEGEQTLLDVCNDLPPQSIQGLIYRADGAVLFNGERSFIKDLDSLPFPKLSMFELEKYSKMGTPMPIVTSRGCPYQCIYCPVVKAIGQTFRYRTAGSVADEFEYWHKQGIRVYSIVDDNFTLIKKRVLEICATLKMKKLEELRIMCGNGVRADRVDEKILTAMKEVGFFQLAYGVEGGNDRILKNIKKHETMEEIEKAIDISCKLGFEVVLFFIIGSPGETFEDFMDSVKVATRYPVMDVRWYNLIPYPGTELYEYCVENKLLKSKPEEYLNSAQVWSNEPLFESPEFPIKERRKALKIGKSVNRKLYFNYYKKRFSRYGFLGWILAYIITRKGISHIKKTALYGHLSKFGKKTLQYN